MRNFFVCTINLFLLFALIGCEKIINVDLNEIAPKVVIEGLVTDNELAWVKLSKTSNYFDTSVSQKINHAIIIISDNTGNTDTLKFLGEGFYKSTFIKGAAGRTYMLTVFAEGKEYHAQSFLPSLMPIDSLKVKEYSSIDGIHEKGYYPLIFFNDPPKTKDFYTLVYYKNNKLLNKPNDLQVTDDNNLQLSILGYEVPYVVQTTDTFKVELYSLSEDVYNYYADLSLQLNNDGGLSSSPSANARGNISNEALGCFQASSVRKDSIIIP